MNITTEPIIETTTINHAVEIYNPTNGDIDLSNYRLELTAIDNLVTSIDLEGTLPSKKTFVVSNSQSTTPILIVSNLVSLDLDFNDIIVLKLVKNDTIVLDKIGNEGPSIHLSEVDLDSLKYPDYVASININMGSLENLDLRRDALIQEGRPIFVAGEVYSEWALYLGLEFSNLGIHECACAQPVVFFYGADLYLPEEHYPEGIISRWCQVRITEPLPVDITLSLNYTWHRFDTPNVPATSDGDIDWHTPSLATDLTWVTSTEYNDYEIIDEVIADQIVEGEEGSGIWLIVDDANGTGTTVSTTKQFFDFVIFDPLTSTKNITPPDFKFFPTLLTHQNSELHWETNEIDKLRSIKILHSSGKTVLENNCVGCNFITLPLLKMSGLYYIEFRTDEGVFTKKFIKV